MVLLNQGSKQICDSVYCLGCLCCCGHWDSSTSKEGPSNVIFNKIDSDARYSLFIIYFIIKFGDTLGSNKILQDINL